MRQPNVFTAQQLKDWNTQVEMHTGVWVPARPIGFYGFGLLARFQCAWAVFTGKADVVTWYKQEDDTNHEVNGKLLKFDRSL